MSTPVYTHGHDESVLRSHRARTAQNSAAYLLPHLREGLTILDVGCGPGTITVDLASLVAPGQVTAVDPAQTALDATAALVRERGLVNVKVESADVHALPYDDDSFDVVHAHQTLQHLPDPVGALREMRRVCKPDGVVAARDADYQAMTWYPEVRALDEWKALYRRIARANGGEPDGGRHLLAWARAAGFEEVKSSASVWCFAEAAEKAWWSESWSDRVGRTDLMRPGVDAGWATDADVARMSQGWLEWGVAPDAWFAVLHGEILCRG